MQDAVRCAESDGWTEKGVMYLSVRGCTFIFSCDGWRYASAGRDSACTVNPEGHFVRSSYTGREFTEGRLQHPDGFMPLPYVLGGLYVLACRTFPGVSLSWQLGSASSPFPSGNPDAARFGSCGLLPAFAGAWFRPRSLTSALGGIFSDDFLASAASSADSGAWEINPFTWRIKQTPEGPPLYAQLYDFIEDCPVLRYPGNGYGALPGGKRGRR